jgi:hypothetical protein
MSFGCPGDVFVVVRPPRKDMHGIIAHTEDGVTALRVPCGATLVYMGQHESGDYLFIHRGQAVRAPATIFKYLTSLKHYTYRQSILDSLRG